MGRWFTGSVDVVKVEGQFVAVDGWNGEMYLNCWMVEQEDKNVYYDYNGDTRSVRPIYEAVENEDLESDDDFEIVGYEFC